MHIQNSRGPVYEFKTIFKLIHWAVIKYTPMYPNLFSYSNIGDFTRQGYSVVYMPWNSNLKIMSLAGS